MKLPKSPRHTQESFTVATFNILMDKTRTEAGIIVPQAKRLPSIVEVFSSSGIDMDVVAIQEAEQTFEASNGDNLARSLGFAASYWVEHNQLKRRDEYIGMFGNKVENPTFFDIGFYKQAVMTMVGETAVVGFHTKRQLWGTERELQTSVVLDRLREFDQSVLLVDTNALWFEKSRRMLKRAGFRSAFHERHYMRPSTFPTEQYRDIMLGPWQQRLLPNGLSIDDIYVRGMDVENVGVLHADTDHLGLWATVKPKH
ncbi:MAG: hypothetical protein ABIR46_01600 [Candidatus Saccharimonadales bacterium]